jgi:hypothetical protein
MLPVLFRRRERRGDLFFDIIEYIARRGLR